VKSFEWIGQAQTGRVCLVLSSLANMKYNGGIGYNYIFEVFLPKLKEAGIKESSIEKMLKTNPENFYK